jgi:hypothetical protein
VLLISGPEGCGKTVAAKLILANYKIYHYTLQDIRLQEAFENFSLVYKNNLRAYAQSNIRHAIIIDDFESLSDSDKAFHTNLTNLIKSGSSNSPPIVLTTTTLGNISDKKRTKKYKGIAKLATEVVFNPLKAQDIGNIFDKLNRVRIEDKVASMICDFVSGDARKAVQTLELIARTTHSATSATTTAVVTNEMADDWISNQQRHQFSGGDYHDDKLAYVTAIGTSSQSDEDRIIALALAGQSKSSAKIPQHKIQAAFNVVCDNSVQFTPLIFQVYPAIAPTSVAARIADDISEADCHKVQAWTPSDSGSFDLSDFSIWVPVTRLKRLKNIQPNLIKCDGYQTFYTSENEGHRQHHAIENIRGWSPELSNADRDTISVLQQKFSAAIQQGDDALLELMLHYNINMDQLEQLSKFKSIGECDYDVSIPRTRKKGLQSRLTEAEEKKVIASVKFTDSTTITSRRLGWFSGSSTDVDSHNKESSNPFALKWD